MLLELPVGIADRSSGWPKPTAAWIWFAKAYDTQRPRHLQPSSVRLLRSCSSRLPACSRLKTSALVLCHVQAREARYRHAKIVEVDVRSLAPAIWARRSARFANGHYQIGLAVRRCAMVSDPVDDHPWDLSPVRRPCPG